MYRKLVATALACSTLVLGGCGSDVQAEHLSDRQQYIAAIRSAGYNQPAADLISAGNQVCDRMDNNENIQSLIELANSNLQDTHLVSVVFANSVKYLCPENTDKFK